MPELGPMMRALELQRVIEDKVSEWRDRSARVTGGSIADSYQQPNFKRHTNRRKNSAEINRIIAKYSKPNKRFDERHHISQNIPAPAPTRPARHKKLFDNLKISRSEDNLASIGIMDHPDPTQEIKPPPRTKLSKYNTKSCEDITAFIDIEHTIKSKNFEENSILNSKSIIKEVIRPKHYKIKENLDMSESRDSGLNIRMRPKFATSTPLSNRKTCPVGNSVFEKCNKYNSVGDITRESLEPDVISVGTSVESVSSSKTMDIRRRWKMLKPKKGAFDCILRWRGKRVILKVLLCG